MNDAYFINDKRAFETVADFALCPARFDHKIAALLAHPGGETSELMATVEGMALLWREVIEIAGAYYHPRFPLNTVR